MRKFLDGWLDDVPGAWRSSLDNIEPDVGAIAEETTLADDEIIFPGRRGHPAPDARSDSHVFRALEGMPPKDVRAVILGQDPYPKPSRATGRSFEQGDLAVWSSEKSKVAESLRRILQAAGHFRTGEAKFIAGDAAWPGLVNTLPLEPPRQFFDAWQAQGVLCINAALTLSRFEPSVQKAHFGLWRPVVKAMLETIATRTNRAAVFLLWGAVSQSTFQKLKILEAAQAEGTEERVAVVNHAHPRAEDATGNPLFFKPPNVFKTANERLVAAGGQPISW